MSGEIEIEGNFIRETGEVVLPEVSDDEGVSIIQQLATYESARAHRDLARADLAARTNWLTERDPEATRLSAMAAEAEAVVEQIEYAVSRLYSAETRSAIGGPISLRYGAVNVTFPKPSRVAKQGITPRQLLERAERGDKQAAELVKTLRIKEEDQEPRAPTITIKQG